MIPFLLERSFACVNPSVIDPSRSICKCCITEFTLEGAFSRVDTHVTLKGLFLGAAAPTHGADKTFVAVEFHMLLQALHAHKPVVTHLTFKVPFFDMHNHMALDRKSV
jgi:hypothetical protein